MATPNIKASSTTFAQLKDGGLSGHLARLVNAQTPNGHTATAPTANATAGGSTGGLLAAGNYLLVFTETNGFGETVKSSESASLTVAAGNIPQVTFAALQAGNTARNLYCTAAGGATGTETLYATGITGTTFNMAVAKPTSTVVPPTANSTGITARQKELLFAAVQMRLSVTYNVASELIDQFIGGSPIDFNSTVQSITDQQVVFAVMATLFNEIAVLVAANPGTISTFVDPNGMGRPRRTFS